MRNHRLVVAIVASLISSACTFGCAARSGKTRSPATTPASAGGGAPATAIDPSALAFDGITLAMEAPANAKAGGDPTKGYMITGDPLYVSVKEAGPYDPADLAGAHKYTEDYDNVKKGAEEELPDGFVFLFESEEDGDANFWVLSARRFGDRTFACSTMASSAEQQAATVAACKSLRPAK